MTFAGGAHAATLTVDSTSADPGLNACSAAPADCSFPGAISRLATYGDTIVFSVASTQATDVALAKSVTIEAAGASLPRLRINTSVGWAEVLIRNAVWQNINSGSDFGGAMYIGPLQEVTIEDSQFLYNRSGNSGRGGAIYNEGRLVVTRTRFEGNYSPLSAGGIHTAPGPVPYPSSLLVVDSVFRANGVLDPAGPNRTLGQFGAIKADGSVKVRGSLFYENESKYASAIQSGSVMFLYNSTLWGNKTFEGTEGGALLLGGPARIVSSTIAGNSGTTSGGLFVYPMSDTQVVNSLIANNTGASPDISGRIYSLGNNLIRSRTGALVEGNLAGNDIYDADPRLATLANNGGLSLTVALLPGSPALDAGSNCVQTVGACDGVPSVALNTDQRGAGFPRQRDAQVDIGAFELGSVVVSNNQDSGAGSLRQAISDALPGDVVSFSPGYFSQPRTIALANTLVVNKSMSIVGPGADLLTLDANNLRRHLNVDAPATLNLRGMRFTRGNPGAGVSGGAILVNLGTLSASEITIDSSTGNVGGCIYNNGTLNLALARLSGCQANVAAGIFNEAGKAATISDTRIENSVATGPGGGIGNPGTLVLTRVSLSGNQGTIGGGLNSYGTATITNTTFSGNTADNGGGMYLGGTGTTTLTHATVTANSAGYNGGVGAEFDAVVNLKGALISGNTRTIDQAPDAGGNFTSFGHNLIGSTIGTTFRPSSPSLIGNIVGAPARLAPLAENGGHSLTHAPLHNSQAIDAGGPDVSGDARGLARPIDFSNLANANGGNGSDIGAFELQVSTPTNVVATPAAGGLSVGFSGGANGGPEISSYHAVCGAQSATGTASPILVSGLAIGVSVTCHVTASSAALTGIPSAPSNAATPAEPITFSSPPAPGGSYLQAYSHTLVASATPPATFALADGTLPPGLSLDSQSGVISGLPSAVGTYSGTLGASNGVAPTATQAFSIQIAATVPDAPIIGTAVAGDGYIEVHFTPPQNDGGSAITDYTALCSVAASGSQSPIVINNLANGVPQRCRVFAINAVGGGVASGYSNEVTPQAATTLTLTSGAATVTAGSSVTFTASVTPAGAGGLVTFSTGPSSSGCAPAPLVAGSASCTTLFTAAGTFPVSASYAGAAAYVGSSGQLAGGQAVIAPTITIAPDLASGVVGTAWGPLQLQAGGGADPYVFSVTQGSLPPGLALSSTGLLSGTPTAHGSFAFTVTATDANQFAGARAYTVQVVGVPSAPTAVVATRGNGEVSVAFVAPASDGGSAITGYTATCGAQSQSGSASPITVSGLANGIAVTCTVIATNAIGNSVASTASNSVTPATLPDAPGMFEATAGNGTATLRFAPPASNGGSPVLDYRASCSPGGAFISGSGSPLTVAGLANGTLYECVVSARNAVGSSPDSVPSSVIPSAVSSADVSVTMSNGTNFVTGGATTTYAITVSNPGPAGVARVRVQDVLDPDFGTPSWTCSGQGGAVCAASGNGGPIDERVDLPIGSSVTLLLTATVAALPETPVSNLVSVTLPAPFDDPNLQNNVATDGPDIRGLFRDGLE